MRLNKRKNKTFYESIQNIHNLDVFKKDIFYCELCESVRDINVEKYCSLDCLENKINVERENLKYGRENKEEEEK